MFTKFKKKLHSSMNFFVFGNIFYVFMQILKYLGGFAVTFSLAELIALNFVLSILAFLHIIILVFFPTHVADNQFISLSIKCHYGTLYLYFPVIIQLFYGALLFIGVDFENIPKSFAIFCTAIIVFYIIHFTYVIF